MAKTMTTDTCEWMEKYESLVEDMKLKGHTIVNFDETRLVLDRKKLFLERITAAEKERQNTNST